jgi:hypothetical protein
MANNLKLKKQHIDYLSKMPENGMGYQLVDIILKDGKELKNRIVFNSTYLKLIDNEKIMKSEIKTIKIVEN